MKTSTKLLIIFFTCIPATLLAYNFLLKNEFKKSNFTRSYYPDAYNTLERQKMQPFKHIAVTGFSITEQGRVLTNWCPQIAVGNFNNIDPEKHTPGNYVNVIRQYHDNVKTIVKNDTLFISFTIMTKYINLGDLNANTGNIVEIEANNVQSVNANAAYVTINNKPSNADSLFLSISDKGKLDIQNLNISKLHVVALGSSDINISKNNRINNLNYALIGQSSLNIDEHPVQQFHAGKIDSLAKIQLIDKASYLQKQLH